MPPFPNDCRSSSLAASKDSCGSNPSPVRIRGGLDALASQPERLVEVEIRLAHMRRQLVGSRIAPCLADDHLEWTPDLLPVPKPVEINPQQVERLRSGTERQMRRGPTPRPPTDGSANAGPPAMDGSPRTARDAVRRSSDAMNAPIQLAYWSRAAGTSPFQPWQNRKTFVTGSCAALSVSARLMRQDDSCLSLPSASKLTSPYSSSVPGILSRPMMPPSR